MPPRFSWKEWAPTSHLRSIRWFEVSPLCRAALQQILPQGFIPDIPHFQIETASKKAQSSFVHWTPL